MKLKMGMVKLEQKKQKNLKTLSKAIYVFAIIGKICAIIGTVFVILGMSLGIAALSSIDLKVNNSRDMEVKIGSSVIQYKDEGDKLTLAVDREKEKITDTEAVDALRVLTSMISRTSKSQLIGYLATMLVFTTAGLIITAIILSNVEKLFKRIAKENTPFTMENVATIKKIGYFMIGATVLAYAGNSVIGKALGMSLNLSYGFSIITILIVFAAAFICEYGANLQADTEATIYGDDE